MRVQLLEWDSQFFGYPVGRLRELSRCDSAEAVQECVRKSGCHVVYVGTTAEKPELSEHYILTQVELHSSLREPDQWSVLATQPVGETEGAAPSLVLQPYGGTADDSLVQLALQAGWSSRFCMDVRFGKAAFERLYATWIDRSCTGELADVVLTAGLGWAGHSSLQPTDSKNWPDCCGQRSTRPWDWTTPAGKGREAYCCGRM